MKPRVFIVADWYLPGFKAGGLITALSNFADSVGDAFDLYVFTRDRDLTDENPYPNIRPMEWMTVGRAQVLYASDLSFRHIRKRICEVMPDIIYLNSFFSTLTIKTLCLRKLDLLPPCAVVLVPRGELSTGALAIKRLKKNLYRNAAVRAGLYHDVIWQAISGREAEQITAVLRAAGCEQPCIRIAPDLCSRDWLRATRQPPKPPKSSAGRFLCISRIAPVKNFLFALNALRDLQGHVEFDIFGPIDDQSYWQEFQKKRKSLPANIVIRYRGIIPRERVLQTAANYDFFLLPTQGESFGYSILEALAAGCPVILSDQTLWRNLAERGAGWTLPLDDLQLWRRTLQHCVEMESETYASMSQRAREFVETWAASSHPRDETVQLFNFAISLQRSPSAPAFRADLPLAK
jgi:glycosyltransferase involved in cell wall biosynthesis